MRIGNGCATVLGYKLSTATGNFGSGKAKARHEALKSVYQLAHSHHRHSATLSNGKTSPQREGWGWLKYCAGLAVNPNKITTSYESSIHSCFDPLCRSIHQYRTRRGSRTSFLHSHGNKVCRGSRRVGHASLCHYPGRLTRYWEFLRFGLVEKSPGSHCTTSGRHSWKPYCSAARFACRAYCHSDRRSGNEQQCVPGCQL